MIKRHGKTKWKCLIDHKVFDDLVEAKKHAAKLCQEQRLAGSLPWMGHVARRKFYLKQQRQKNNPCGAGSKSRRST
jgi:hypothetical protein